MQTPSYTTLAAAISTNQQTDILLTANPPFTPTLLAPLFLYIGGEAIQCYGVDSLNPKHLTQIYRGYEGTKATPHANGTWVIMGSAMQFSSDARNGDILSGANPPVSSPQINFLTGEMYSLSSNIFGTYQKRDLSAPEAPLFAITPVADVAYTALISDYIIQYTSLTAARAVTLPAANAVPRGTAYIVKDGAGAAATDNITVTATIDGGTNKVISTNYGTVRVYSDGTAWFTW